MRRSDLTEARVVGEILVRLAHANPEDLLNPVNTEEQQALADEATVIRGQIDDLTTAFVNNRITVDVMGDAQNGLRKRLEDVEARRQPATRPLLLAEVAGIGDVEELRRIWEDTLTLARRREIVAALCEVRILKARKGKVFDPATVEITWR